MFTVKFSSYENGGYTNMSSNVRPESMERITTPALAQKFIDE